jgi:hypothetical protein
MEANMNVRQVYGALILIGSIAAAQPSFSQAQSTASAPKPAATAPAAATPNTNTNPTKHRYWRHRGGSHPHYGSRRVRT